MIFFLNILFGLMVGVLLETSYRSLQAKKIIPPELINIQIYGWIGFFISLLYLAKVSIAIEIILLFIFPTLIEFIIGYLYFKIRNIRLWDYRDQNFNFLGIICLRFSIYWFILSSLYYYFILPILITKLLP